MANAHDVAAYILGRLGPMTAMKLQKLVYYSQAWHIVREDRLLFPDTIEAWAAGPVVRSLYNAHRGRYMLSAPSDIASGTPSNLGIPERKSIDVVLAHYGAWTAEQLSDLSHSEAPWQSARKGLSATERGESVIDPTEMSDYYSALARSGKNKA